MHLVKFQNPQPNFTQNRLLVDDNCGAIYGVEFDKNLSLEDALKVVKDEEKINVGLAGDKKALSKMLLDVSSYPNKEEFALVKSQINTGSSSIVFETVDGDVLKLTRGNHFPLNRPVESFDVPIDKKWEIGKTHIYKEEKLLTHSLCETFTGMVEELIKQSGYKVRDMGGTHQVGISDKYGRVFLLDPECARYKTIFHAIFDKVIRFISSNKGKV